MTYKQRNDHLRVFTHLERYILKLIAEGYRDNEIADELNMSEKSVKESQVSLMRKLNAPDMSSAIGYALGNRLISIYEVLESRFSKRKREAN